MDEPYINCDTESQLFHTEKFKGIIMHNVFWWATSNWTVSLSESSCSVMNKGFGNTLKCEKSERFPLKYNFVMEKSWQSSYNSRLMRNVRRSVHQVNVRNENTFSSTLYFFIFSWNIFVFKNRIISGEMWRSLKEKNYSKFGSTDHYDKHLLPCSQLQLSQLYSGNQPAD